MKLEELRVGTIVKKIFAYGNSFQLKIGKVVSIDLHTQDRVLVEWAQLPYSNQQIKNIKSISISNWNTNSFERTLLSELESDDDIQLKIEEINHNNLKLEEDFLKARVIIADKIKASEAILEEAKAMIVFHHKSFYEFQNELDTIRDIAYDCGWVSSSANC